MRFEGESHATRVTVERYSRVSENLVLIRAVKFNTAWILQMLLAVVLDLTVKE